MEGECDDRVPELYHKPMRRRHRHRATTCLAKRSYMYRSTASSLNSTVLYDSTYLSGTSSYCSRRTKNRSSRSGSTDRNSTRLSAPRRKKRSQMTLPPDVSSINMYTAATTSQLLPYSTIQLVSPENGGKASRQAGDGETNDAAHHSTPKDASFASSTVNTAFDVTGHTDRNNRYKDGNQTPVMIRKHNNIVTQSSPVNNNNNDMGIFNNSLVLSPPLTCIKVSRRTTKV